MNDILYQLTTDWRPFTRATFSFTLSDIKTGVNSINTYLRSDDTGEAVDEDNNVCPKIEAGEFLY